MTPQPRVLRACFAAGVIILVLAVTAPFTAAAAAEPPEAGQFSPAESPLPVFELHSGFWVNLHHFLYLQARLAGGGGGAADRGRGAAPANVEPAAVKDLSAEEKTSWERSIAFYAQDLAGRDLQVNSEMEIINNRLSEMENCADLSGKSVPGCTSGLRANLVTALEGAAPVYRTHWWPEQDLANRRWIAAIAPLVREKGVELSQQLTEVYQRPWPAGQLRVDVVWYAGPYGAYTSVNPIHVTISSRDARNQGIYGFEVLFHESSHVLAGAVTEAIAREFRRRDKPIPRDLWHALLFYTAGELVRRDVANWQAASDAAPGDDPARYQPYAARFGLYSGSWGRFRSLLDIYWRPYLEGRTRFDSAISRLAFAQ